MRDAGMTYADCEDLRDEVRAVRDGIARERYLDQLEKDVAVHIPDAVAAFQAMRAFMRERDWQRAWACARVVKATSRRKRGAFVFRDEAREIRGVQYGQSARRRGWRK